MASFSSTPELQQLLRAPEPKIHLAPPRPESAEPHEVNPEVLRQRRQDLWWFLVGWRVLNALTVATFFQPDEYYQALEPAWQLAFGKGSGVWMTWEWTYQLRSSIHPTFLALVYTWASGLGWVIGFPITIRVLLLDIAPKIFNAFLAATLDFYTWELGQRIYGHDSTQSYAALLLCVFSPWQWFASTRSLINGLEASCTILALCHWPWSWLEEKKGFQRRGNDREMLKYCVVLASIATLLRPTNLLIWFGVGSVMVLFTPQTELLALIQDTSVYGTATLALANGLDRLFYGIWTFPAAKFLQFNLVQDLAVFYGRNRPDYYFTEGLPLLLTTATPFALAGIFSAIKTSTKTDIVAAREIIREPKTSESSPPPSGPSNTQKPLLALAFAAVLYTAALSLISHKEVRFLHPLLPIFSILAAPAISSYFHPFPSPSSTSRKLQMGTLLLLNTTIAIYVTRIHARGVIDVLHYLRDQFTAMNTPALVLGNATVPSFFTSIQSFFSSDDNNLYKSPITSQAFGLAHLASPAAFTLAMETPVKPLTAAFLMPCHSTPWRSHLVFPDIKAWALTCEPPVHITDRSERDKYMDEADIFYADPVRWLNNEMSTIPVNASTASGKDVLAWGEGTDGTKTEDARGIGRDAHGKRLWPLYVVFFEQLIPVMEQVLGGVKGSRYKECWRGFNSHWHDDSRRKGDVIVWCVDGGVDREDAIEKAQDQMREEADVEEVEDL